MPLYVDSEIPLIIVIRHGECVHLHNRLFGQFDVALSEQGKEQIRHTSTFLSSILDYLLNNHSGISTCLSSDLLRCKQSAEIIKDVIQENLHIDLNFNYTSSLREFHIGNWENKSIFEIKDEVIQYIKNYNANQWHARPPGLSAESDYMVLKRVYPILKQLKTLNQELKVEKALTKLENKLNIEDKLRFYTNLKIRFNIHILVVHEGSIRMILNSLDIPSWTPDVEKEFIYDEHQTFIKRGDLLIIKPTFKQSKKQEWEIAYHYRHDPITDIRLAI